MFETERISGVTAPRYRELISILVNKGASNKEIAHEMGLRTVTVNRYLVRICRKFGVSSRSELICKVMREMLSEQSKRIVELEATRNSAV